MLRTAMQMGSFGDCCIFRVQKRKAAAEALEPLK